MLGWSRGVLGGRGVMGGNDRRGKEGLSQRASVEGPLEMGRRDGTITGGLRMAAVVVGQL